MWRIDVGVGSGSDEVKRRVFNRPADNALVMAAATANSRFPGVVAYDFFIIGNPYEGRTDILETIGLLRRMPTPVLPGGLQSRSYPGDPAVRKGLPGGDHRGDRGRRSRAGFPGGLDFKGFAWKKPSLYLNSLVGLLAGKSTRRRLGFVPRKLIPALTRTRAVDFRDRHIAIGQLIAGLGNFGLRLRRAGLKIATRSFKK